MSGLDLDLEPKQLTLAAKHLETRIPDVVKVMTTMSKALDDNKEALVGGVSAELAAALNAWATTAAKLPQVLADYAMALAQVGATAKTQEANPGNSKNGRRPFFSTLIPDEVRVGLSGFKIKLGFTSK